MLSQTGGTVQTRILRRIQIYHQFEITRVRILFYRRSLPAKCPRHHTTLLTQINLMNQQDLPLLQQSEIQAVSRNIYQDVVAALDTDHSFMIDEKLPEEQKLSLHRICYGIQKHCMQRRIVSPTITKYYRPRK